MLNSIGCLGQPWRQKHDEKTPQNYIIRTCPLTIIMCDMFQAIFNYKRNYVHRIADSGAFNFVVVFVLT
jgi:hypothetical protein